MIGLDIAQKKLIQDAALGTLIDQFWSLNGRAPHLDEFPEFLASQWKNKDLMLGIFLEKNRGVNLPTMISSYPNFWTDLWTNAQLEKFPRSIRPDREVT